MKCQPETCNEKAAIRASERRKRRQVVHARQYLVGVPSAPVMGGVAAGSCGVPQSFVGVGHVHAEAQAVLLAHLAPSLHLLPDLQILVLCAISACRLRALHSFLQACADCPLHGKMRGHNCSRCIFQSDSAANLHCALWPPITASPHDHLVRKIAPWHCLHDASAAHPPFLHPHLPTNTKRCQVPDRSVPFNTPHHTAACRWAA